MKKEVIKSQWQERQEKRQKKLEKKFAKDYKRNVAPKRKKAAQGAKELQKNTPASELWYYALLKRYNFPVLPDRYLPDSFGLGIKNQQYDFYIPDLINNHFKFLIEVDDSSHANKEEYDKARDKYFRHKGFKTFRIPFNDNLKALEITKQIAIHIYKHKASTKEEKKLLEEWINEMKDRFAL